MSGRLSHIYQSHIDSDIQGHVAYFERDSKLAHVYSNVSRPFKIIPHDGRTHKLKQFSHLTGNRATVLQHSDQPVPEIIRIGDVGGITRDCLNAK